MTRRILTVCSPLNPIMVVTIAITTGDGNDIIIGGEDGEIINDADH